MAASAFSLAADEPPSMRCRYYRTTRLDTIRYARALLERARDRRYRRAARRARDVSFLSSRFLSSPK